MFPGCYKLHTKKTALPSGRSGYELLVTSSGLKKKNSRPNTTLNSVCSLSG